MYNCQNPVYPPISHALRNKPKNERPSRHPQRDHDRPDTHIPCSLALEERFRNDRTPNRHRRADEERSERPTRRHRRITRTRGAPDITHAAEHQRDKEDRPPSEALRERFPDQRAAAQYSDLQGGEVADFLDGHIQVDRDVFVRGDDAGCNEGAHEGVECHQDEVGYSLFSLAAVTATPHSRVKVPSIEASCTDQPGPCLGGARGPGCHVAGGDMHDEARIVR